MTKENASQYLPLVQALAEGKTIQALNYGIWVDVSDPLLNLSPEDYRIKPEPREFWVNEYKADDGGLSLFAFNLSEEAAKQNSKTLGFLRTIHVREVI